jgi:hypothetical protein
MHLHSQHNMSNQTHTNTHGAVTNSGAQLYLRVSKFTISL